MSLEKTPSTIWQIWMSHEFDFKVKDVFWRLFRIPKKFNLYKRCCLKRLFTIPQIPIYIESVSSRDTFYNSKKLDLFEKTISTIPQNPIYIAGVSWRETFHNFTNFNSYYKCLLNLILYWMCLFFQFSYWFWCKPIF